MRATRSPLVVLTGLAVAAAACARQPNERPAAAPHRAEGSAYVVHDTTVNATFDASGVAAPFQQATLSTKLMGTVTDVLVKEGDVVAAGQPLVRIDARDLAAKQAQVAASIAEADAVRRDAMVQAGRMRALYADSAATKAQLDAAETGLARAEATLTAARAAGEEVAAATAYAVVRAPFAATVTKRFADPGTFAAPGAPLVSVQDASQLRLSVAATPDAVRNLRRGQPIDGTVEGRSIRAIIEGVVPAGTGNLYTVNAIVSNAGAPLLAGSSATLAIPAGRRTVVVVPVTAVVRQGDLTGVTLRSAQGDETRWVRLGRQTGGVVEVSSGLRAGDVIVVPPKGGAAVAERN